MIFLPPNLRNPELVSALQAWNHAVVDHLYILLSVGEKYPRKITKL